MFRLSKIIFEYPLIYIVGVVFLITALLSVFISLFPRKSLKSEIDEVNLERKITKKSLVISFISGCLIMPFLETLIFQFSVIRLIGNCNIFLYAGLDDIKSLSNLLGVIFNLVWMRLFG